MNEPDRHWVAIELPVARLDGGDDDEEGVQDPEDRQDEEADEDEAKDRGDAVVDEHRDLEVECFLAVRIDLGRFAALRICVHILRRAATDITILPMSTLDEIEAAAEALPIEQQKVLYAHLAQRLDRVGVEQMSGPEQK